jgi:hypothetical protein
MNIDIIALQKPAVNTFNQMVVAKDWIAVYPTMHEEAPHKTRSITLVYSHISMDSWNQLDFPSSDVTVIQLSGTWGKLTLFNIYNEGNNNDTINALTKFYKDNTFKLEQPTREGAHLLWLEDFNRHHPHWDDPNDMRLFTREGLRAAEILIKAIVEAGLEMVLLSGTPTHLYNITKCWSRLN